MPDRYTLSTFRFDTALTAILAFGLVSIAPALAECGADHAFIDRQITEGVFRPDRFPALPSGIPDALRLIREGSREKAQGLFDAVGKTPEAEWRQNANLAAVVLDARLSAWLLADCPL